jgi:hypothetical protein
LLCSSALANAVAQALRESGYRNGAYEPATVDNFRTLKNVSILFVDTHGANGYLPDGSQVYGLQTTTAASQ